MYTNLGQVSPAIIRPPLNHSSSSINCQGLVPIEPHSSRQQSVSIVEAVEAKHQLHWPSSIGGSKGTSQARTED